MSKYQSVTVDVALRHILAERSRFPRSLFDLAFFPVSGLWESDPQPQHGFAGSHPPQESLRGLQNLWLWRALIR